MLMKQTLTGAAFATMCAAAASAGGSYAEQEQVIYPYATHTHYCQEGLQPVVVAGVISCGKPNSHLSYQSVKMTPARHHKRRHHHASTDCAVGVKGCR